MREAESKMEGRRSGACLHKVGAAGGKLRLSVAPPLARLAALRLLKSCILLSSLVHVCVQQMNDIVTASGRNVEGVCTTAGGRGASERGYGDRAKEREGTERERERVWRERGYGERVWRERE